MSVRIWMRVCLITVLLLFCYGCVHFSIRYTIKNALENIDTNQIEFSYKDLDLSLLTMSVAIDSPVFTLANHIKVSATGVKLSGIHPKKILFDKKIEASSLELNVPRIILTESISKSDSTKTPISSKDICINHIDINDGSLKILNQNGSSSGFQIFNIQGFIKDLVVNTEALKRKIPFTTSSFEMTLDSLQVSLDPYHILKLRQSTLTNTNIELKGLQIVPLMNKAEFHQAIKTEKDYIHMNGALLQIEAPRIVDQQKTLHFLSKKIKLDSFQLDIYRDKRIANDTAIKPLYSQLLRELNTKIQIDSLAIINSLVRYIEHPDSDADPGKLEFHELTLHTGAISNFENAKAIQVNISSSFMNQAPFEVEWSFDSNDLSDYFNIKGSLLNVRAASLNSFLTPVMQIKAKGALDKMYFNFDGNHKEAKGAMQLSFQKFDVEIYDQETKKLKSLLSSIANMIIGGQENKGMVTKDEIDVERDPTKSFWNYFWLCIRKGLLEIII
ncbi:hypothetical protein J8281_07060 [Aquimarina sp. U1-2]|uniref:hypothetical protein n=1 Tax=Aquimarina sp. U1-2 TaxID=2823141 RepID=UPI001AECC407|nr:hypothetical protein [Aquimarina sp. U1-2]MBP2831945.1 hypothetical protein [Aquimarina sp. U1-2]